MGQRRQGRFPLGRNNGGIEMKKEERINEIIDDIKANRYDSEGFVFDLIREALNNKTEEELKDFNINKELFT